MCQMELVLQCSQIEEVVEHERQIEEVVNSSTK